MNLDADKVEKYKSSVIAVEKHYSSDILICSSNLFPGADSKLIPLLQNRKTKRRNLLLLLTTPGGSADVAHRIARSIQHHYKCISSDADERGKFLLFVPRYCKSAGTVLALGANEIFMSELAELGPIDVQLLKEDEVGDWTSGLTAIEAMSALQEKATALFMKQFRDMRFGSETRFSTRMATDIAARMTIGLLAPVYAQIDPMRLGEIERFVRIAVDYAQRLATENVKENTIETLVVGYPSHGFIIDRREAETLFKKVRVPCDDLEFVGASAFSEAKRAGVLSDESAKPVMRFENEEMADAAEESDHSESRPNRSAARGRETKAKRKDISLSRTPAKTPVGPARNGSKALA